MKAVRTLVSIATLVLASCGGGGGGDSGDPPPPSASTPVITTQPASATVANGDAASFTVAATGNGTLSYAWRKDGSAIPNATGASYSIAATTAASAGNYDVVITNTLNGTATATSSAAVLTVIQPPTITTQPAARTQRASTPVALTVSATAGGTLGYAWRKNGVAIAGATSATYSLSSAVPADSGTYDVVVTNTQGGVLASVTSSAAVVTIIEQPVISAETAVLASTGGHMASTPAVPGTTFAWTIVNGTISAGQGTNQITYSAGTRGEARLAVTVGNSALTLTAVRPIRVVNTLPAATLFAPPVVHTQDLDIRASGSAHPGYVHSIVAVSGTAAVVATATGVAQPYFYASGNSTGTYTISENVSDALGNSRFLTKSFAVGNNVFLRHKRDPIPRSRHTATLMGDGRVLVVGGDGGVAEYGTLVFAAGTQSRVLGSAEIFDPITENWADAGSIAPRWGHTATLLNDGRVLVVGGAGATNIHLSSVALYDPDTGAWTAAAPLGTARTLHSATLLLDGRVLVTGGVDGSGALAASEIYDPAANAWSPSGAMMTARVLYSATRLADGRVLVVGGRNGSGVLGGTEIFNPATGAWSAAASLSARNGEGAVLLPSGKVLQLGATVALYDPTTDSWSELPLTASAATATLLSDGSVLASGSYFDSSPAVIRVDPVAPSADIRGPSGRDSTATLLVDGRVLIVGGTQGPTDDISASEQVARGTVAAYNPSGNFFNNLGSYAHRGAGAVSVTLPSGRVLFAGGEDSRDSSLAAATANTTFFEPTNNLFADLAAMPTPRAYAAAVLLANGRMLVAGGTNGFILVRPTADSYDPATNTWSAAGSMSVARFRHTLSALPSGGALAVGGSNATSCSCTTFESSVDRFDPVANAWTPANPLITARDRHTATTLPDGRILVVGGYGGVPNTLADTGASLANSEVYDPATGNWTATGSLAVPRQDHVAISLGGGRVLVAGGANGSTTLTSAEIYDAATGLWTAAASMNVPRRSPTIATLPDGRILVANGLNGSSSVAFGSGTAEIYDPVANTWSAPVPLSIPRVGGMMMTLVDGRVLILGGFPNYAGAPEFYR